MLEIDPAIEHRLVAPDRLVFSSPRGGFTIIDKAGFFRSVLISLENGTPVEHAFEGVEDPADRAAIADRIIGILRERGVIRSASEDSTNPTSSDLLWAWLRFVGTAQSAQPMIGLIGEGQLANALQDEIGGLGLVCKRIDTPDNNFHLVVACADLNDRERLRFQNKQAVDADVPFLPVWMQRHIICVGPIIIPGATACVECLHHREEMNRTGSLNAQEIPHAEMASSFASRYAAMLATVEIARFLAGAIYDLHIATFTRHSLLNGKRAQSVILKLPRCPVCGPARDQRPLVDTFALEEDERTSEVIA